MLSWGYGNLLAPWGQDALCLLRNTDTFASLGTGVPSTWDISCLPGNKITFACLGTRPLTTYLGTRSLLPARGHGHLLAPWGQGPWPSPSSGTQLDGCPLCRALHSSTRPPQVPWAGDNTEVAPRTAHLAWFNLITPNLRRHWHQDWRVPGLAGVPATHWGPPSSHQFLCTGAGGFTGTVLRVPADSWDLPSTYLFSNTGAGGVTGTKIWGSKG